MEHKHENGHLTQTPPKPKVPMYLVAIVITLAVLSVVLGIMFIQKSQQHAETLEDVTFVKEQKQQLEVELNELIIGYDSLKTENDSINVKLISEQDKIRRLLRTQASNSKKLQMYQKELTTLRKVMRSYIIQIDSLNTRNRELTEENVEVRQQLRQVETDFNELTETKDQLTSKVALAQKLTAKNIIATGLTDRSKEKDKIAKIAKIRVCFTIRENNIADSGKKMIYLRITRPDDIVLSSPSAEMFEYQEQQLVYSEKRELEYDQQDIDMCIFWDKKEELIPGTYFVTLYSGGHEIGSTTFDLK